LLKGSQNEFEKRTYTYFYVLSGAVTALANDKNQPQPPWSIEGLGSFFVTLMAYIASLTEDGDFKRKNETGRKRGNNGL
jgi:hypothetical protein